MDVLVVASAESVLQQARQVLQRWQPLLTACGEPPADDGDAADVNIALVCQTCSNAIQRTETTGRRMEMLQQQTEVAEAERNPHEGEAARLQALAEEAAATLAALDARRADLAGLVSMLAELDAGFGRTGVQSFALEGILGELQERTQHFLEQLASGFSLQLAASRPAAAAPSTAVERITKTVLVRSRDPSNGLAMLRERNLRQLSGGERRRIALALVLGFADLISARGRLRCNLMVLDEVMQQLDEEGCARVAAVLRRLPHTTVLLVGQANTYVAQTFDAIDVVVKQGGQTTVEVAP
ncbi:probable DNA double-strand break repair Rad50 ATPase [Coccomyxa sp. Obi]|nr:probable DNA double-strand break repair Rad50 ATPase [Coccomyxa sp. Obi]